MSLCRLHGFLRPSPLPREVTTARACSVSGPSFVTGNSSAARVHAGAARSLELQFGAQVPSEEEVRTPAHAIKMTASEDARVPANKQVPRHSLPARGSPSRKPCVSNYQVRTPRTVSIRLVPATTDVYCYCLSGWLLSVFQQL